MEIDDLKTVISSLQNESDADTLINLYKERLNYYKTKNIQYENIIGKLNISPHNLDTSTRDSLYTLAKMQEVFQLNKLDEINLEMSLLEHLTKKHKYKSDLKKMSTQLEVMKSATNKIHMEIARVEKEVELVKHKIENIDVLSPEELQLLKMKIKSYEDKSMEYLKNYPWLKNPDYNMLSIKEEIRELFKLSEEMNDLKSKIDVYEELKPDINTAKTQLIQLKNEYENIYKLLNEQ